MEILCPPMPPLGAYWYTLTHTFMHRHIQPYVPAGVFQLLLLLDKGDKQKMHTDRKESFRLLIHLS